jgi:hypothetical protein
MGKVQVQVLLFCRSFCYNLFVKTRKETFRMKTTREKISGELKLIRKYFGNWKTKLSAEERDLVKPLAEKYNKAICKAAPWDYDIYLCVYVQGQTAERLAEEADCSVEYMRRRIKRMKDYFAEVFADEREESRASKL